MAAEGERGFEDLECYQLTLQVLREAYRVAGLLPPEERYNLADQLRRSAVSIVLNIAEGYGRYHYLDSLRFHYVARGSLEETLRGFIAARNWDTLRTSYPASGNSATGPFALPTATSAYVRRQQQGRQEYGDRFTVPEQAPPHSATVSPSEPTEETQLHPYPPIYRNPIYQLTDPNLPIYPFADPNLPSKERSHGQLAVHPNRN